MRSRHFICASAAGALLYTCAAAQTVKIGVQAPLSGERRQVGRLMVNGLQMAADRINNRNDGRGIRFDLILEDDEGTQEGAAKALKALTSNSEVMAIVGEINSPLVLAAAPAVDRAGIVYLTAGSNPRTTEASPWIFRIGASDTVLADVLTRYAVEELHLKALAVVHDRTGVHNQRAVLVTEALKKKYGIEPLADVPFEPGERSFVSQMQRIKAVQPTGVLVFGETPEGASFFRAAAAAVIHAQIIGQRDFGVKRVFDEAGGAANRSMIVTEYAPEIQESATREWNAEYAREFGADANIIAAQYYDALMLLAESMHAGNADRSAIRSELARISGFSGIVGAYTFGAGRNGIHRFYIARVEDGHLSLIGTLRE